MKRKVSSRMDYLSSFDEAFLLTIHARIREKNFSQFSLPTSVLRTHLRVRFLSGSFGRDKKQQELSEPELRDCDGARIDLLPRKDRRGSAGD